MTIRTKLILSSCLTVVLPLLIVAAAAISEQLSQSKQLHVSAARREIREIDGEFELFFEAIKSDVRYLASLEELQDVTASVSSFLSDTPTTIDSAGAGGVEAELVEYFAGFLDTTRYYALVYFGTEFGGLISTGSAVLSNWDPRARPWYQHAVASPDQVVITPPYLGGGAGPMLSVAKAVRRPDGSILGVQSVDVTLETLTEIVRSTTLGERGYLILIDDQGTVLADPRNTDYLFTQYDEISDPLYRGIKNADTADFLVDANGVTKEVIVYTSPGLGWQLVGVIDSSEIFAPAYALATTIAQIALVMLVLFTGLGILLASRISSPISQVSDRMRQIASGKADLTARLDVSSKDEIGDLARYFNQFLELARQRQSESLRVQKMEAVWQLAAGIAHEINTPTQFVGDNTKFLQQTWKELDPLFETIAEVAHAPRGETPSSPPANRLTRALEAADLEYVRKEVPQAITESLDGVTRIAEIVRAMKEFSHPGSVNKTDVDLNHAIETTITVARNEWKYVADVQTDLDPKLPRVACLPGEINQVLLNLLVNAAHAVADVVGDQPDRKGTITVSTRQEENWVVIRVQDTGPGVPADLRERIFEPFFTTKEVGKGTGQGLALAYSVVVDKHGGRITYESTGQTGATFVIRLPLDGELNDAEAAA